MGIPCANLMTSGRASDRQGLEPGDALLELVDPILDVDVDVLLELGDQPALAVIVATGADHLRLAEESRAETLGGGHEPQASTFSAPRRQRMPASMKSSRSPSKTALGLPDSWPVRRSLTIW
jgi:hypothetical protein